MREVEPHDLELYAVNTGELYNAHKQLVGLNSWAWIKHVRDRVIPRYSREIEPVFASETTVHSVADALNDYYTRASQDAHGGKVGWRKARLEAYKRGEYTMQVPPVTTGGWDETAWCNFVKFNDSSLRGFDRRD